MSILPAWTGPDSPQSPVPIVHYLTLRLHVACQPERAGRPDALEGAPLNTTYTRAVTCPDCLTAMGEL